MNWLADSVDSSELKFFVWLKLCEWSAVSLGNADRKTKSDLVVNYENFVRFEVDNFAMSSNCSGLQRDCVDLAGLVANCESFEK